MIFSPSFVGFTTMFISDSAPDEPARIIAGQITCPQGTQSLFDLFYTAIQLKLIPPPPRLLSLAGFVLGSSK